MITLLTRAHIVLFRKLITACESIHINNFYEQEEDISSVINIMTMDLLIAVFTVTNITGASMKYKLSYCGRYDF